VDGNSYKIVISSYFCSSDAPKIVFFLTNKYARKSLVKFSQKILSGSYQKSSNFLSMQGFLLLGIIRVKFSLK